MDNETYGIATRKFLTAVPLALFVLATHGTDFRKQPLGLNLLVVLVLVIAKLPKMHGCGLCVCVSVCVCRGWVGGPRFQTRTLACLAHAAPLSAHRRARARRSARPLAPRRVRIFGIGR